MLKEHFGVANARVVPVTSIMDIKKELAKGNAVLLPANGKLLRNPNFRNGGPPYHMITAKGYTDSSVIVNDPGTRLGADYVYKDDVLFTALADWVGANDVGVASGPKVMIVVE